MGLKIHPQDMSTGALLARPKLFYVDGIRHSAVVVAPNADDAVRLAAASERGETGPKLLYGHVDSWEVPTAHELKLPGDYRLTVGRPKAGGLKSRPKGLKPPQDPIELALSSKKRVRTSARDLERLSEREQGNAPPV